METSLLTDYQCLASMGSRDEEGKTVNRRRNNRVGCFWGLFTLNKKEVTAKSSLTVGTVWK
jgi:hypothetical protein